MAGKTLEQLAARAQEAIDNDENFVYDVAAEYSQQVGNVKHMTWFKKTVMRNIALNVAEFKHLADDLA